jgi:hypothetical protein
VPLMTTAVGFSEGVGTLWVPRLSWREWSVCYKG